MGTSYFYRGAPNDSNPRQKDLSALLCTPAINTWTHSRICSMQGSNRRRERILAAQMASCFYCATVFDIQAIEQWIDGGQTALPHCGIDGVLPVIGDEPDVAFIWAMHRYWF
jgi:hypothetical protein